MLKKYNGGASEDTIKRIEDDDSWMYAHGLESQQTL